MTVKANKVYNLTVAGAAATWTAGLGAAGYSKPVGDLAVKFGAASFLSLTGTGQSLVASGAKTNSTLTNLLYKTTYNFVLDGPDSYSMAVVYTINAP